MKIVQTGDLTVQVPIEQNDEIGYLASSFNTMTSNLKNVIDRNSELIKKCMRPVTCTKCLNMTPCAAR